MDLKEIMNSNNFVVLGNTTDEEKYAYKIKEKLLQNKYNVACVDKQYKTINDVPFDIDVLDPVIAPGISVGFRDGLTKEQLFEIVDVFMENKDKIKSIDVVEFNPLTDIDNKTLRITVELIERIIEKLKEL